MQTVFREQTSHKQRYSELHYSLILEIDLCLITESSRNNNFKKIQISCSIVLKLVSNLHLPTVGSRPGFCHKPESGEQERKGKGEEGRGEEINTCFLIPESKPGLGLCS